MTEAQAPAPGLAVGTTLGNYRVERKIGEGGMGAVYLAEHPLIGRKAAVKVLLNEHSRRPDVVTRFFNEAKTAASLHHPALVEVFDFGFLPDGAGYIVMEYLEGESLAARLERVAPLPPELAAEIGRQLCAGVGAAHGQGIVHRDLKPDNIFLVPDPEQPGRERVKILDFGIAKLVMPGGVGSKGATTTGMLLGTPLYMAPEQCRGSGQVDHRADIYSVGCILYTMLTGRPPFDYEGVGEILAAHLHEPVVPPRTLDPTLPEQLESIVLRALAKSPDERYQSMSDLGADLQRFVLGPTGPARPGADPGSPPRAVTGAGAATTPGVRTLAPPTPVLTPRARASRPAEPLPSLASAELEKLPQPRRSSAAGPLLAALVVAAGGAGGFFWWRGQTPEAPPEVAEPPASAPAPAPSTQAPSPPPPAPPTPTPTPPAEQGAPAPAPTAEEKPAAAPAGPGAPVEPAVPAEEQAPAAVDRARPGGANGSRKVRPAADRRPPSEGQRHYDRAIDHRARGEEAQALLAFRAALRAGGLDPETGADASRQAAALRNKFGELELETPVSGAEITVDGRRVGRTPLPAPLLLRPGKRVLVFTRAGYRPITKTITIAPGERQMLRIGQQ